MRIDLENLLIELRALERSLHEPGTRHDVAVLNRILHHEFIEFGASGQRYNKADIIAALTQESDQFRIWSDGFEVQLLGADTALLIYTSARISSDGEKTKHALRSSIWQRYHEEWQIRFHQGTPISSR